MIPQPLKSNPIQIMFVELTARRSADKIETIKEKILGPAPDDPNDFFDRLAKIIGPPVMRAIEEAVVDKKKATL